MTETQPATKKALKAAELQRLIMERLSAEPDCAAITAVYVKHTGLESPEEIWGHVLVARRPGKPRDPAETKALQTVLAAMRQEFDLLLE
jgi:hypothetical protein